jgi:predicted phage-related endonuclease
VVASLYKPDDVACWAEAIGGIDALAIDGVSQTVSPASMLMSGIDVARLDGRRATAERWAAAIEDLMLI